MRKLQPPAHLSRFEALCRERGIPATVQRRAIFQELMASGDHPTARRIYRAVHRQVPGISQTTVYRGLELLVDMGLARKASTPGNECRYDPRTRRHHHLICTKCGAMADLEDPALDALPLPSRRRTGFRLDDYSIQFLGLCPACSRTRRPRARKVP